MSKLKRNPMYYTSDRTKDRRMREIEKHDDVGVDYYDPVVWRRTAHTGINLSRQAADLEAGVLDPSTGTVQGVYPRLLTDAPHGKHGLDAETIKPVATLLGTYQERVPHWPSNNPKRNNGDWVNLAAPWVSKNWVPRGESSVKGNRVFVRSPLSEAQHGQSLYEDTYTYSNLNERPLTLRKRKEHKLHDSIRKTTDASIAKKGSRGSHMGRLLQVEAASDLVRRLQFEKDVVKKGDPAELARDLAQAETMRNEAVVNSIIGRQAKTKGKAKPKTRKPCRNNVCAGILPAALK